MTHNTNNSDKGKGRLLDRRGFLKLSGSVLATSTLVGCTKTKEENGEYDPASTQTGPIPTDKMTYRINPKQGDKVSILGYGWMRLPTMKGGSARTQENVNEDIIDQEECNRLAKFALDHGVNYFDTSPAYCRGKSEETLGIALEASGYRRNQYYIATKLSNFAEHQWSLEEGQAMFERSLQYLRTDYIDYLLLHSIGGDMNSLRKRYLENGLLDWLMEQREAGRIRNLGFSFHGQADIYDYALSMHEKVHWDFVQIQANYVDWHNEKDRGRDGEYLYTELEKRNIPVVIMEPLLGGRLSKVPDHVVAHFKKKEPEASVASWAFRYIGSKPAVLTVLSGMTYMEHLEDNLRSYCPLKELTQEEQEWLEGETAALIKSFNSIECNDCKYCMPCPYGLDIPAIFTYYNKRMNAGLVPESKEASNYKESRRIFLVGYDRAVPRLRQADHCVGCRKCVPHCPQNIDIPGQMERINSLVEKLKQETL